MRIWVIALGSVALASCGEPAPPTLAERIERTAASFNKNAPGLLPSQFGDTQLSSRLEGDDTLVMRFANAPVADKTFDPNAVRKMMRRKVCETGPVNKLIQDGGRLKIELVSHVGAEFPAVYFARCPTKQELAAMAEAEEAAKKKKKKKKS